MMRSRWPLAVILLILAAAPTRAQIYVAGPSYGFAYARQSRHSLLTVTIGGFAGPSYSYNGIVANTVTLGGYPGGVFVPLPPPVLVAPEPILAAPPRPAVVVDQLAVDILPRAFLQGRGAVLPPPPAPLRPEPMAAKKPVPPPADLPRPPLPLADPKAEHARLVEAGLAAFGAQEYARAAELFRQATRQVPTAPTAHFQLGLALFALGKHAKAHDVLQEGLRLSPQWPTAPTFQPRDPYGLIVADYTDQRRRLADALAEFPGDPYLLFQSGYHLWFDGRRDEARGLFRRALAAGADPQAVDCFLKVAAPPAVALGPLPD